MTTEADEIQSVPGVISNALGRSCSDTSYHYALNIPFLKQRRNFAKRAIFLGNAQGLFDEFLFEEYSTVENGKRKTVIDINAVEYVDGEPETLLDYLDKILIHGHIERLGGSNRGDVNALRNDLIFSYGAVNAIELDCEPGQTVGCKTGSHPVGRTACDHSCRVNLGKRTAWEGTDREYVYDDIKTDRTCFAQCAVYGRKGPPDIDRVRKYR